MSIDTPRFDEVLARFAALDPTAVSDALDALDLPPGFGDLKPMWGDAAYRGTWAELGQPMKDGAYERLANALAEFKDN